MFQRVFYTVIVLTAFILLTAMGSNGGFERAPRVEKNFAVTITDVSGNAIDGQKFSWEGRTQFSGFFGMAQVSMPFDKIKEVTVGELRDRAVKITVLIADGSHANFEIDAKSRCYGEAKFGSFMLTMKDIKKIVFK